MWTTCSYNVHYHNINYTTVTLRSGCEKNMWMITKYDMKNYDKKNHTSDQLLKILGPRNGEEIKVKRFYCRWNRKQI